MRWVLLILLVVSTIARAEGPPEPTRKPSLRVVDLNEGESTRGPHDPEARRHQAGLGDGYPLRIGAHSGEVPGQSAQEGADPGTAEHEDQVVARSERQQRPGGPT